MFLKIKLFVTIAIFFAINLQYQGSFAQFSLKFWGVMDYFYAGTGSPEQGLENTYLKTKFSTSQYSIGIDYHHFKAAKPVTSTTAKYLADELDFSASYNLNKFTINVRPDFLSKTNHL